MNLFIFLCVVLCVASIQANLKQKRPAPLGGFFIKRVKSPARNATSSKESDTYTAAVVEFNRSKKGMFDAIDENLEAYTDFIAEAKKQFADIVIFPEGTLNSYGSTDAPTIAVPPRGINPCHDDANHSKILIQLSCAANMEKIYVVVNVAEKADCDSSVVDCPHEDYYLFNTNVVFDRNGTIISRYRKINLFGEDGFSPSVDQELGVFDTDFGVRFGHFICFDLMFQNPSLTVISTQNVSNIIFPTMWFSEMPFLTAVQIHEGYAFVNNVNFLAAGANIPEVGSSGTGIYSGKNGILIATINGHSTSKMLVSIVSKDPSILPPDAEQISNSARDQQRINNPASAMDSLFLKKDNLRVYETQLLDNTPDQKIHLTYGEVDCQFEVKMNMEMDSSRVEGDDQYLYRAVAFHGVKLFDVTTGGVTSCAIVACTNDTLESCGQRFPNHETVRQSYGITKIVLKATVPSPNLNDTVKAFDKVYYPVTLDTTIMPLGVKNYKFLQEDSKLKPECKILTLELTEAEYPNLLTFGIFGRAFEKDGSDATGGCSIVSASSLATLSLILIAFVIRA